MTVLEANNEAQRVELDLWRKNKGYGRVWHSNFGLNITSAILNKDVSRDENLVSVLVSKEDPATGLDWQNVKAQVWMPTASLVDSPEEIWDIASANYNQECNTCHRQPDEASFSANSWPAQFAGMVGFTSMDDDTAKMVLKYLQTHSSDSIKTAHGGDIGCRDARFFSAEPRPGSFPEARQRQFSGLQQRHSNFARH